MSIRRHIRRGLLVGYAAVVCVLVAGTIYSYWYSYGVQRAVDGTRRDAIARIDVSNGGVLLGYAEFDRVSPTRYAQWYWYSRKRSDQALRKRPAGTLAGATHWQFAGFSFYRFTRRAHVATTVRAPLAAVLG